MFSINKIIIILICLLCLQTVQAQWQKINTGNFAWFNSVYFLNQNKGWIVGSQGTFLETNDGGANWKAKTKFTQDTIKDVYFVDENHGWILAEKDFFGSYGFSPSYISETFDGGNTWKKITLQGEGKERLVKIFFSKDGFGRAVGEAGTLYAMQEDKVTWKRTTLPSRFLLLDGSFFNQNQGVVVGGGGTSLFTEDGGNSWGTANFTIKPTTKLNTVFFINQNIGWAGGAEGKIFATSNGGKSWREQKSNVKDDLFDIHFINTAEGWAVGDKGVILHTTTAGNVWKPFEAKSKHKLERIFFNGQKIWVVGFGGTVLSYDKANKQTNPMKTAPLLQNRNYSASN